MAVESKFLGFIEERLTGIEEIKANGSAAYTMRRLHGIIAETVRCKLPDEFADSINL